VGMDTCRECCVLSGRGVCDEPITCPEESYRLCCVVVCDLETLWMRRPWPTGGGGELSRQKQKQVYVFSWKIKDIIATYPSVQVTKAVHYIYNTPTHLHNTHTHTHTHKEGRLAMFLMPVPTFCVKCNFCVFGRAIILKICTAQNSCVCKILCRLCFRYI
jgi:hypothetical protein